MEGLFQLLIVAFFIVSAIFDAVSRNRKKQEQKERMEAEEAAEAGPMGATRREKVRPTRTKAPTGERSPASKARPWPATTPRSGRPDMPGSPGKAGPGGGERETADAMIPEDFWAILTGQAPNPRTTNPEPPTEPDIPVPVPSDRMGQSGQGGQGGEGGEGRGDAEEAVTTRRSSRWMEGLDEQGGDHLRGGAPEAQVPVLAGTRPREVSSFPTPYGSRADPMDEPWGALEDISRGEIGDGRGATQGAVDLYGEGAGRRRAGASDSPYVRLVSTGRQEDLKAAIVLREVLGAPVGSRGPNEGPGGWRWDEG